MSQLFMRRANLDALPAIPSLPEGFTLRTYRETDLEPLARMLQSAFPEQEWTVETLRKRLVDAPDVKTIFVIETEGLPVATASARLTEEHPGSGYVHWVAADPLYQGQKLGYAVTLATLHEFARLGCKDAVLETDDHRLAAIKTYRNLGFEPENRHETHAERWTRIVSDLLAAANL